MLAELNKYEKEIKDILDIKDISVEKLQETLEEHEKWKNDKLDKKDAKSWLFKQELIFYNLQKKHDFFFKVRPFAFFLLI